MRDYKKNFRARFRIVHTLYSLGLSVHEISMVITQWSEPTISNDITRMGGLDAFPNRPKKKGDVFAAVIKRYAVIEALNNQYAEDELRDALETWLRKDLILAMLYGVESTLCQLVFPSFPSNREPYARLLGAIFKVGICGESRDTESSHKDLVDLWWQNILTAIHFGEEPFPHSREELYKMIIRRALYRERADIMPIWDEKVFLLLDDMMLMTLTEREREVLFDRFGIGAKKRTLKQVSDDLLCSSGRVHQLEKRAIRKLQKEARGRQLEVIGRPVGNALQREFEKRRRELEVTKTEVLGEPVINPNLFRKVEDLSLSTRALNCMINDDIVLVGELVQKTEADCLKIKNFGRFVLKNINDELAKLGLRLGMQVSDGLRAFIAECRKS